MDASFVPRYLIEQTRDRDYSVENFYKYQQTNCLIPAVGDYKINPFNHLWVLINKANEVKGVLWMVVDSLSHDMVIQMYSIDEEYWNRGYAVKKVSEHVKEIVTKGNLNKIYWITNYPKHSERYGFKRSKSILMEFNTKETISDEKDKKIINFEEQKLEKGA